MGIGVISNEDDDEDIIYYDTFFMSNFKSIIPKQLRKAMSKRILSPHFNYEDKVSKVSLDDVILSKNDPRADGIDPNHVDALVLRITTTGVEEDAKIVIMPSDTQKGKYDVIDGHHLVTALRKAHISHVNAEIVHYIGNGSKKEKWAAASDLGQRINNSFTVTKKQTMASLTSAAISKIDNVNYIYRPNTPVDELHIRYWMEEQFYTSLFAPHIITKIVNNILNRGANSGTKVRLLNDNMRKIIFLKTNGRYGNGRLNGNRNGFVVKTDNWAADAPKVFHQILALWNKSPDVKPVIITYSGKDDAQAIVDNHSNYAHKIWLTYKVHLSSLLCLHGLSDPDLVKYFPKLETLTYEEFLGKMEIIAIGQLDGEHSPSNDFISRPL